MNNIHFYGETNVGRVRGNNEDAFIATTLWDDKHTLLAAIDGLGGYEGGEVAADIARGSIIEALDNARGGDCLALLKEAVTRANNAIIDYKESHPALAQMGCVLTAAIIEVTPDNTVLHTAHVGDTRLYRYCRGNLDKLTRDHSLVGYREEIGELTEEEAMSHPRRNLVDRIVGQERHSADDRNFIDAASFPLEPGTCLLFCSDGLTDLVTTAEIKRVLAHEGTLDEKCRQLISLALDHGGRDNVTVVLAHIDGTAAHPQEEDTVAGEPPATPKRHKRAPLVLAILVTLAAIAAIAYFALRHNHPAQPTPVPAPMPVDTVVVTDSATLATDTVALRADSLRRALDAVQQRRVELNDSLDGVVNDIRSQLNRLNPTAQP